MAFTISSLVWLILLIAFVVVEALTVSLVSIWFAAGAVAALIVSGFTSSWLVQFAVKKFVGILSCFTHNRDNAPRKIKLTSCFYTQCRCNNRTSRSEL